MRPPHLPDFEDPPLNEVVLGVQFSPAKGYQQIRAGEVWGLFKAQYPIVEEHMPLAPSFETFGPRQSSGPEVQLLQAATHDRFWFMAEGQSELLQFQQDRLLHNWRKRSLKDSPYPRFEAMLSRFTEELERLEAYFSTLAPQSLVINQCEVSYINHIPLGEAGFGAAAEWVSLLNLPEPPSDLALNFARPIFGKGGERRGRLRCELASAYDRSLEPILVLTLIARGEPDGPTIPEALEFITSGRDLVVSGFAEVTTPQAHERWRRIQ